MPEYNDCGKAKPDGAIRLNTWRYRASRWSAWDDRRLRNAGELGAKILYNWKVQVFNTHISARRAFISFCSMELTYYMCMEIVTRVQGEITHVIDHITRSARSEHTPHFIPGFRHRMRVLMMLQTPLYQQDAQLVYKRSFL